jgi:putative NADH-flavin reductase
VRIALLGATGTIGSAYLQRALADDGDEVRALVRDRTSLAPAKGLTVVIGDARDPHAVASVVADSDAVVSAVGPRTNTADGVALLASTATNIITAMRAHAVSRVVFVAGAGVALPGERRSMGQKIISALVRRAAKWVVAAKERELNIYLESEVDWTAIRPPRVVDGPPTGRVRLTEDRPHGFRVSSGDVAASIATVIADPSTIRRAPYVSAV